jgi:single-stranded-DNA-specific exonuclease
MEKKWVVKEPIGLAFKKQFPEIPGIILQLLYNRGLTTQKQISGFLQPEYGQDLLDPFLFADMDKAVKRVYQAVANREKVAVYGDYDADGVTSTVVMANILKSLGLAFEVYIPHREKDGYGLNQKAIKFLAKKKVKLIITVDCAISNVSEVDLANKLGLDVIITDHHTEPNVLPKAYAIINPKVKSCGYPYYDLAGVGVAFKFAQAIIAQDKNKIFLPGYEKWLLDLVAIGTVTDVMPLLDENRSIVKYGLIVLNKTKNIGLKMLAEKAGILPISEETLINSDNIGYILGPRINAAGRMDHANTAYELLMTANKKEAIELADKIEKSNARRQTETEKIVQQIKKQIAKNKQQYLIWVEGKNWPQGLIGIVAGKIKDELNRPIFIINKMNRRISASGRSIPEYNMIEPLKELAKYFSTYGGHAAAAGFTLKKRKDLKKCKEKILAMAAKELKGKDLSPKLEIEAELDLQDLNWELYQQIVNFEPFGQANPKPIFLVKELQVENVRLVGNGNKHLKLSLKHAKMVKSFEAIGFGMGDKVAEIKYGDTVDVVCEINLNKFNGSKKLELRLVDIRKAQGNKIEMVSTLNKKVL